MDPFSLGIVISLIGSYFSVASVTPNDPPAVVTNPPAVTQPYVATNEPVVAPPGAEANLQASTTTLK